MLIPVALENLRGRRWPYVSIVLIVLNFVIFFTDDRMQREVRQIGEVPAPYSAFECALPGCADVSPCDAVGGDGQAPGSSRGPAGHLGCSAADPRLDRGRRERRGELYHSHFPHWGWLHIIFNMWFLWLAGTILEDAWGRMLYPIFYLISRAIALVVHSAVSPGMFILVAGASGAIVGLMSGFLAGFPTTRIRMFWYWGFPFWCRPLKFFARAYILLPLWLAIQVFWGVLAPSAGGVVYWAHIGGFAFGVVGALILQGTGVEQAADRAIAANVSWTADPRIVCATDFLDQNQLDAAIAELRELLQEKPDSLDGLEMLLKV